MFSKVSLQRLVRVCLTLYLTHYILRDTLLAGGTAGQQLKRREDREDEEKMLGESCNKEVSQGQGSKKLPSESATAKRVKRLAWRTATSTRRDAFSKSIHSKLHFISTHGSAMRCTSSSKS